METVESGQSALEDDCPKEIQGLSLRPRSKE